MNSADRPPRWRTSTCGSLSSTAPRWSPRRTLLRYRSPSSHPRPRCYSHLKHDGKQETSGSVLLDNQWGLCDSSLVSLHLHGPVLQSGPWGTNQNFSPVDPSSKSDQRTRSTQHFINHFLWRMFFVWNKLNSAQWKKRSNQSRTGWGWLSRFRLSFSVTSTPTDTLKLFSLTLKLFLSSQRRELHLHCSITSKQTGTFHFPAFIWPDFNITTVTSSGEAELLLLSLSRWRCNSTTCRVRRHVTLLSVRRRLLKRRMSLLQH